MSKLSANDLHDVLRICQGALECRTFDELTEEVLRYLEYTFQANSVAILKIESDEHADSEYIASRGLDSESVTQYQERFRRVDPILNHLGSANPSVITADQITSYRELKRSEYYNEFLKPRSFHYLMGITLKANGNILANIGITRPSYSGDFTNSERFKADLLARFLAPAVERVVILQRVTEQRAMIDVAVQELPHEGVVILDKSLTPVYVSSGVAHLFLAPKSGEPRSDIFKQIHEKISQSASLLSASEHVAIDLVEGSADTAYLSKHHTDNGEIYFVCIGSRTDGPHLEKLSKLGISERELEVLKLVYMGHKNAIIAEQLFISERTVENHIASTFRKLGVKSRTQLIHRIIELTAPSPLFSEVQH